MAQEKAKKIAGKTAGAAGMTVRGVLKILLTIMLIFLMTGLLFMCIFAYYVKTSLTEDIDLSLEDYRVKLSSTIWYQDPDAMGTDEEWKELTMLYSDVNRIWVDYEQIPKNMEHAVVAIEDQRFYTHKGVDWYRTVGAFVNMFLGMKNDFGGSTVTQQLIKNITEYDDITVQRKLLEIFRALDLEKEYDKEEIMEYYLNMVYFGEGSYGVEAAAQTYFGKSVGELSLAECASIAGITNNPSRYDPFISRENNKKRQETILWEMYDQGYISHEEYVAAVNEELVFVRSERDEVQYLYSYYEETVINDVLSDLMAEKGINKEAASRLLYNGGYQIYCFYNPKIQAVVDAVYTDVENLPQPYRQPAPDPDGTTPNLQSAIVIMDPYNGAIVALAGRVGEKDTNFPLNFATDSLGVRSPGSAFKPLASYGPAMEYGLITANTEVNDSPDVKLSGTSWYPRNADMSYRGWINIRTGLALSLNTVAAQIIDKLTPAAAYEFLTTRLGFTSLVPEDADYAAMALGELHYGVTVREMTQAYSAFINDGTFTYSRTYSKVLDSNGNVILDNEPDTIQAFSKTTADNMVAMLRYNVTNGIAGSARLNNGMPSAGKTGTSSDSKNRYFMGFTPYYVAGVWTGYEHNQVMYFSGNPALQIWTRVMNGVDEALGLAATELPTGTYQAPTGIFGSKADDEPEPTPTPSPSPSPSTEPTATPTPTPSPTPTPEQTPEPPEQTTAPPPVENPIEEGEAEEPAA